MSQPEKKRKLSVSPGTSKKSIPLPNILLQKSLENSDFQQKIKKSWDEFEDFEGETTTIQMKPFRHGEIKNFIANQDFLKSFSNRFSEISFREKSSDLFQFKQSDDLKSVAHPYVDSLSEFLSSKVLPVLKNITGLPLNLEMDMFLSDYRQTDFLLCHDDELDSRRIAFILYLSEEWKPEFGGSLDLFSSNENVCPVEVVKSIQPEYNKFVFFEVTAKSFHQVKEVTKEGVSRLALSGWFYGTPLPRPVIELPQEEGCSLKDSIIPWKGAMEYFADETYLTSEIYAEINDQLTAHSEVLLPNFLRNEAYSAICANIVELDLSKTVFRPIGPANISSFEATCFGRPELDQAEPEVSNTLKGLAKFFYSADFLQFLQDVTEFPFTTCPITNVTSSLRKFSSGSYSLLKSGGAKQTCDTDHNQLQHQTSEKDKNGDTEKEIDNGADDEDEEEDGEGDPTYMDVLYFFGSNWNEDWGGSNIYTAEDGEQLITVSPEGNCLAIVVRTESVNSYVNYVNCLAKDEVYFAYTMTFAFNGKM